MILPVLVSGRKKRKRKEVIFHGVVTDGFTRHWAKGDLPVVFMGKAEHSPLGIRVVPFRHWIQMQAKQAHLFLLASLCLFRPARVRLDVSKTDRPQSLKQTWFAASGTFCSLQLPHSVPPANL